MRSTDLALSDLSHTGGPKVLPIVKPAQPLNVGRTHKNSKGWASSALAVIAAILLIAVFATSQLAGLRTNEDGFPASQAIQPGTEAHPLVGSWIVRSSWMSRNDPPLLMSFNADGTMLVTDRSAETTGHGHWVVTSDGVAFEYVTVELDGNDLYYGLTTAHGEITIAPPANEWTGVYRTFLTTPAGNVPSGTPDTDIIGERIVAEPPRGPDRGPATPEPKS